MVAIDPTKSKSSMKWKSSLSTSISQPFVEHIVRVSSNHANSNVLYQHMMSYLHSLGEKVSQLTSAVQPMLSAWNDRNSTDSYQVRGSICELSLFCTNVFLHCWRHHFDHCLSKKKINMQNNFIKETQKKKTFMPIKLLILIAIMMN